MSSHEEQVIERLDLMLAVLQLANHDAIERARQELRADPLNAAILDACPDWTPASVVYAKAKEAAGASERTIRTRLVALEARRALWARGSSRDRAFRATGLV